MSASEKPPVVITTTLELLDALRKAETFVALEVDQRRAACSPPDVETDDAEYIEDAENTLALIRAAIAKVGGGCE